MEGQTMNPPSTILEGKFSGLVPKIHSGECVLVLGPRVAAPIEVAGADGVAIDDYLSGRLLADLGGEVQSPDGLRGAIARYEKERNTSACRSLIQGVVSTFDTHTTELHRNLASLPFRLVLSATPDRMMLNAFRAEGKPNAQEAAYDYCRGVSAQTDLRLPSSDKPIVYSLFGRHDCPESMVLNDKNLLDYLVRITRESPALPDAVRATLRAPFTVFLFIGFGFTNWWLRLLLKVLDVTGVENRTVSLALEDASSFDATASGGNKGFFESVGIYIQADDWKLLAKTLADTFREQASKQAPEGTAGTAGTVDTAGAGARETPLGRPLVFLSYASEDTDAVDALRAKLQDRGVFAWQDKRNLRAGQNWEDQIARVIREVDYFIFVQTPNMDARDQRREDGVYFGELTQAIKRKEGRMARSAVFIIHVTIGHCQDHPEPALAEVHRIAIDTDAGVDKLAADILTSYAGALSPRAQAV